MTGGRDQMSRRGRNRRHAVMSIVLAVVMGCAAVGVGWPGSSGATATGPSLTITPTTGLVDGQILQTSVSGIPNGSFAEVAQCRAGATTESDCQVGTSVPKSANRSATRAVSPALATTAVPITTIPGQPPSQVVAQRLIDVNGTTFDCAVAPGCEFALLVFGPGSTVVASPVPVTFNPAVPPLPPISVTVAIDAGPFSVAGDQTLALHGTVTCSSSTHATLTVSVSQLADGLTVTGGTGETVECGPVPAVWSMAVRPNQGAFATGPARVYLNADVSYPQASSSTSGSVSVVGGAPASAYYVSVGDSLVTGFAAPPGQGYVDDLYAHYAQQIPGLGLANFGCSSETTDTMMKGGICSYPTGSQLAQAEAFLKAHRGKVALLTIDIGGNDVVFCNTDPDPVGCFLKALAHMDANVTAMMTRLRAAAGPGVPFAAMTYFDPLLYLWFNGAPGQAQAQQTVAELNILNNHLVADYSNAGASVADVAGAFKSNDWTLIDSPWGKAPTNVVKACQWLDIYCQPGGPGGFGDDANAAGYQVIANEFLKVITFAPAYRSFQLAAAADFHAPTPAPATLAATATHLTDGSLTRRGYLGPLIAARPWTDPIVTGLYSSLFGRPPDAGGLAYWSGLLGSGARTVPDVAAAFASSAEYVKLVGSPALAPWVTDLYARLLGRPADASGVAYWSARAAKVGRQQVAHELFQAPESARKRVTSLYTQLLGRAPDGGGLAWWASRLISVGDLVVAGDLGASAEYLSRAVARFPNA